MMNDDVTCLLGFLFVNLSISIQSLFLIATVGRESSTLE